MRLEEEVESERGEAGEQSDTGPAHCAEPRRKAICSRLTIRRRAYFQNDL